MFQTVFCTYVLNVLEPKERKPVLRAVRRLLSDNGNAVIAVRGLAEVSRNAKARMWHRKFDGWITCRKTFQKGFTESRLVSLFEMSGYKAELVLSRTPPVLCFMKA
jgi:hypothetical protein